MKKILNSPANYVDEMLAGLVAAHPEYYRLHGDSGKVVARAKAPFCHLEGGSNLPRHRPHALAAVSRHPRGPAK